MTTPTDAPISTLPAVKADAALTVLAPDRAPAEADRPRIEAIKQSVDIASASSILSFGAAAEQAVGTFADAVLSQVMARDLGPVHEHLSEIKLTAKGLDANALKPGGGLLSRLFFNVRREIEKFTDRFRTARSQIDAIVLQVQDEEQKIRHGLVMLDQLFERTEQQFHDLGLHIAAGHELLAELRGTELPRLEAEAAARAESPDAMLAAQRVRDAKAAVELLDRKIANLEKSRSIAYMQMPTIRQVQSSGILLLQEMSMTVTHAIPAWKSTMLIHIEQLRQRNGLDTLAAMTDFTNAQITGMAKALDENMVAVHEQTARGIADVDVIADAIGSLVRTLEKVDGLEADARRAREEGRRRLAEAEAELKRVHTA